MAVDLRGCQHRAGPAASLVCLERRDSRRGLGISGCAAAGYRHLVGRLPDAASDASIFLTTVLREFSAKPRVRRVPPGGHPRDFTTDAAPASRHRTGPPILSGNTSRRLRGVVGMKPRSPFEAPPPMLMQTISRPRAPRPSSSASRIARAAWARWVSSVDDRRGSCVSRAGVLVPSRP